jgi:hypothetical protein
VAGTIPINRIYKFQVRADIIPFPKFEDSDSIYGSASSVSALQLEMGLKYQYRPRMTLDAALETMSARAKFNSGYKEISFHENLKLKVGSTINF